ncbi:MAG TPA: two-component regulator propeller domain-containing protein, partial [Gammaproteobacteria bacterium]
MRATPFRFSLRWPVLLLALCCAPVLAGTPGLRFQTLTIEDGLAQNSVTAIAQDSAGYLWLGSQD